MVRSNRSGAGPARLTARGAATRERIVTAAADLMYKQGVAATTLDQVVAASGISKSQLYHYFPDKDALVNAVIKRQSNTVLEVQEPYLEQLDSMAGLERWRDFMVAEHRAGRSPYGCRVGSLANELAGRSEDARILLAATFQTWQSYLTAGLARMRRKGDLGEAGDPEELSAGIMAALEGGYLLAETAGDVRPFELALDMALSHVRAYLTTRDQAG